MPGYLSVKNFERFQHYKNRNPLWIKLYNSTLDDYDFGRLSDASKLHLICIWLLASRYNNRIPNDAEWIKRRINATDPIDLTALINGGFLEAYDSASNLLATCADPASPEKRRVEESREEKARPADADQKPKRKRNDRPMPEIPFDLMSDGFPEWWDKWQQHRREKGAKLTPTAAEQQLADCSAWGAPRAVAAIRFSIGKGWAGLFEDKNAKPSQTGSNFKFIDGAPSQRKAVV